MTARRTDALAWQIEAALAELQMLIVEKYRDARFAIRRGIDDPDSVELVATVDVENRDDVLDLVIDRVLAYQIDDGLPIHVIPRRPSTSQWERAARATAAAAAHR